jgi:hypothetical protein
MKIGLLMIAVLATCYGQSDSDTAAASNFDASRPLSITVSDHSVDSLEGLITVKEKELFKDRLFARIKTDSMKDGVDCKYLSYLLKYKKKDTASVLQFSNSYRDLVNYQ